jgi:hypothetical protein
MRYIELIVQGRRLTEWTNWETAVINVSRDPQKLTIQSSINGVQLLDEAYTFVNNLFRANNYRPIRVLLRHSNLTWRGIIDADKAKWGRNRMVVDIEIDELGIFERDIAGRRPKRVATIEVALEREGDRGVVASYLVAAMLLIYTIIQETRLLATDIANAIAHASGGATGPAAAAIFKAAMIAIRAAFVALLAASLISILDELIKLLPTKKKTKCINLAEAIEDVCGDGGYSVVIPQELRKIWLIGDYVDTYEATELINLASNILSVRAFVTGNTLRFSSAFLSFPLATNAYAEYYRYNTDDFAGYTLISLSRDFSDRFSNGLPHAFEVRFNGFRGFERRTINESPAKVKTRITDLDRLTRILSRALSFARRIIRRVRVPDPAPIGLALIGSEYFNTKIVYANSPTALAESDEIALLKLIEQRFNPKLMKVYENVKIPFTAADYQFLTSQGFAGVRSLRWAVNSDYAEVDYEVTEILQPPKTTKIV